MKKLCFILLVISLSLVSAQPILFYTGEKVLTPDSQLILKDGNYTRTLTGAQLKNEFAQYEADMKASQNAYVEEVAPGKTNLIIPMHPATQQALAQQKELFYLTAIEQKGSLISSSQRSREYEMKVAYNKIWGKKDRFAAYIDALLRIYGSQAQRSLDAHCNAGGYVFSYDVKALEFSVAMRNGSNPTAHTVLRVFGKTKFSYSGTTVYKRIFYQDELGKTVRFFIGPVPVSVYGGIGGSAGFDAKLSVVMGGIKGELIPGINSYGKADAGVDLWFVKAGVEGKLDLLVDHLPATLVTRLLSENNGTLEMALNVTNKLRALSGKINLFVKVKEFWKFWKDSWKKYTMTLFSWTGIEKNWVLFAKSVKIPLH